VDANNSSSADPVDPSAVERRLAAILAADVVAYSRLMAEDPEATLQNLTRSRELFAGCLRQYRGRLVNEAGDSILADFASVVDAVGCAVAIQRELARGNAALPERRRMLFRIGVNLGDVLIAEGQVYGDGVNIAARMESLAEPGGVCISGKAHEEVKTRLPFAYDFLGAKQVKNIDDPVPAFGVRWAEADDRQKLATAATSSGSGESPSIAVLPFANIGGGLEQESFSDGITEEVITELTRFRQIHVLARNSTLRYKGRAVDVRAVARELGARYVLEGSVRRAGGRIRVTAQLLDARDGSHHWAESYDRQLSAENVFDIQDEITSRIVGAIADTFGVLSWAGLVDARRRGATTLDARHWVLRAHAYLRDYSCQEHARVRDGLERAVEQAPDYADAWGWLAAMYREEFIQDYNARPDALRRAEQAARRALDLDPGNGQALLVLAHVHFFSGDVDAFVVQAERLILLHPYSGDALSAMAIALTGAGQVERGVELARRAIDLNPNHPGYFHVPLFYAHYLKGEFNEALERAVKIDMPQFWWTHVLLAAAYGSLGRRDEARAALDNLLAMKPAGKAIALLRLRWLYEPLRTAMFDGLRKAGLDVPEA
jgi:adenylate cyclase